MPSKRATTKVDARTRGWTATRTATRTKTKLQTRVKDKDKDKDKDQRQRTKILSKWKSACTGLPHCQVGNCGLQTGPSTHGGVCKGAIFKIFVAHSV